MDEQMRQDQDTRIDEMQMEEMYIEDIQPFVGDSPNKPKGKWFGRGIYGSKDVPIRVLDGLIAVLVVITVILIAYFAIRGGYEVQFDTLGGSEITTQKLRYGELVNQPEEPYKPGYDFQGWYWEDGGETKEWNFASDKINGPLELTAQWTAAEITVKFDPGDGSSEIAPMTVTFGEPYGDLPVPTLEGSTFAGWDYSGQMITSDTIVQMTGEHVLTAVWE